VIPWRTIGVCVATTVLVWSAPATASPSPRGQNAQEEVRILDVPYVPQSGVLCGGAALAMVLRYWGMTRVLAEDFAELAEPGQAGIRTVHLVKAVESYGWSAFPLAGARTEVEDHLDHGRPVIAMIRTGSATYHYVVLLAWANGWVVTHDPSVGPFRAIREAEFEAAWSGSGNWALLVLPPRGMRAEQGEPEPPTNTPPTLTATDGCAAMVGAGIHLAQQGDTTGADLKFLAAESLCPTSAAPLRERAGLRFLAEDWAGASRLAERALVLDPSDAHTWRLLAGSRFLSGDVEGALDAWNHLSEPVADLTHIDGLARIRYSAVAGQINLPPGRLLTPRAYRQARRRLAEMPAQLESRLSLKPEPKGNAQVNVTVLERAPVFHGPWELGGIALKALMDREIRLDVASPTGKGELWTAGWRWWENRPRVALSLAVPAGGGRPGIWHLDSFRERQAYATRAVSDSGGATVLDVSHEERRRTGLSFSDWIGPDVRIEIGAALDKWIGRGSHVSLEGSVERRWARDRLALGAQGAGWISLADGPPFEAGSLSLRWCSNGLERSDAWQGHLGFSGATSESPRALWYGAGTGQGRPPLLRAHPLLDRGVVRGRTFGRTLVHGTIERQDWPWRLGLAQVGWALFFDGARSWNSDGADRGAWQVDGGTGLRLRGLGIKGLIRVDLARGLKDGRSALSLGWQVP
jgi:hypothetical protein